MLFTKPENMQATIIKGLLLTNTLNRAKHHPPEFTLTNEHLVSFQTGDIQAHKDGSAHWVRDIGPVVESYIGFVETYVDYGGSRAEWEGFAAIVDKAMSAKYQKLLDRASELIKDLPWGPDFEVDTFRKPDFTALQVLSFATGGNPG